MFWTHNYIYKINYFYNETGTCQADGDCDGDAVVCKGDNTCGACAEDTDCDGDPICKTDNTCGKYIHICTISWS